MKKFSKVKYLQSVGLIHEKFDFETLEFRPSYILAFNSHLALFIKVTWPLKLFVSLFWPRQHIAQLFIGNIYNYLDDAPRFFIGLVGVILSSWLLSIHFCFNRLNTRKDYYLFKLWMRISMEIPVKTEKDYKVVGLSRQKNQLFWQAEDEFNARFSSILKISLFVSCFVFPIQLFFVRYKIDSMAVYVIAHTVNYLHTAWIIRLFLGVAYTLNVFYIEIIVFLSKKLGYIAKQIENANSSKSKLINNRKLTGLIVDYNRVLLELIEMNNFFKNYNGTNYVHFFLFGILLSFVAINADIRLTVALFIVNIAMYVTIVYLPSYFANQIPIEVNKAKRAFENIAFRKSVNLTIKQKIDSISNLSEEVGFSCFDWFRLRSHI